MVKPKVLTLKEDYELEVFENRSLRKVLDLRRMKCVIWNGI